MARPISDEELQLKKRARRRLIGAIVLVTAVAVVLPMVLDREPKQASQDVSIKIPSPDAGAFTPKVAPTPQPQPAPKPAEKAGAPDAKSATQSEPPPQAAEMKPAPAPAAEKEKGPARPEGKPDAVKTPVKTAAPGENAKKVKPGEQYVVQVIAVSDAEKAKEIRQKISGAGIKSYTEVVKTAKGDVTRVRAGPFATREAAEKAQKRLQTIGFNGKVAAK